MPRRHHTMAEAHTTSSSSSSAMMPRHCYTQRNLTVTGCLPCTITEVFHLIMSFTCPPTKFIGFDVKLKSFLHKIASQLRGCWRIRLMFGRAKWRAAPVAKPHYSILDQDYRSIRHDLISRDQGRYGAAASRRRRS